VDLAAGGADGVDAGLPWDRRAEVEGGGEAVHHPACVGATAEEAQREAERVAQREAEQDQPATGVDSEQR